MGRQMNFVRFLKSNAILLLDWSRQEIRQKVTLPKFSAVQSLLEKKHFSQTQWSPYFHRHLRLSFAKTFVHVEQMLALLWNNTLIARRWNACQKNCAIIGKAIKSFRWIGRGGGWCNYEKGAAESILVGE